MTTRVWYENDAIQIDGLDAQPARSLFTILDNNRVHIHTLSGVRLAQLVYTEYARKDESAFASATDTQSYLDGEFAKYLAASVDQSQINEAVDHALDGAPDFTLPFEAALT